MYIVPVEKKKKLLYFYCKVRKITKGESFSYSYPQ